eukprot:scaffold36763_cov45-Prasinocladus_malaysianus.AAC.1
MPKQSDVKWPDLWTQQLLCRTPASRRLAADNVEEAVGSQTLLAHCTSGDDLPRQVAPAESVRGCPSSPACCETGNERWGWAYLMLEAYCPGA